MKQGLIGILTGGGDVPGLNSVIKSVVYRSREMDRHVIGFRRGWEGLTHLNLNEKNEDPRYLMPLTRQNTRTIDRTGGTILHTSRTHPGRMAESKLPPHLLARKDALKQVKEKTYDLTDIVLENLERLGVECLIAIGGDDTLSYASLLHDRGFPVISIPKTMDNDVRNTEYCIGFATAITRASLAITRQRTTVGSHERIGVFRIFGRDAGFTALYAAYATSIRCLIPEYPFDLHHLANLLMEDKRNNPSNYALVVISEGAVWKGEAVGEYGEADAYGHRKKVDIGQALGEQLKKITGEEMVISDLTYDLRSGDPDFLDKLIATTFANIAMDLMAGRVSGKMTAIQDGKYVAAEIPEHSAGPRQVDIERMYNVDRYRPNYSHKLGLPVFLTSYA